MPTIYVFDVGGTYLRSGFFTNGQTTMTERIRTPRGEKALVDSVVLGVERLRQVTEPPAAVAVSIAGIMELEPLKNARDRGPLADYELRITPVNLGIVRSPLLRLLEERLKLRVHIENDTNAAARSITTVQTALVVTFATGISASVIRNGVIQRIGGAWGAYEIGHGLRMGLPDDLILKCTCGQVGCLEAAIGGWGLSKRFGIRPEEAANNPNKGELFRAMYESVMELLPNVMRVVLDDLELEHVVFTGGVVRGFTEHFDFVADLCARITEGRSRATHVHVAEKGELSGLHGVALAAIDAGIL